MKLSWKLEMLAYVQGCCNALIELKFFLVGPNTINFDMKKVLEVNIKVSNSKSGKITVVFKYTCRLINHEWSLPLVIRITRARLCRLHYGSGSLV